MNLIRPSFKIESIMCGGSVLELIERVGRTCYKSESKITPESSKKFVQKLNDLGHKSVIEHSAMTVRIICDRGVTHEIVRHRLCAFSQESTRYCNYRGGVTFIIPPWCIISAGTYTKDMYISGDEANLLWLGSIFESEETYLQLLALGWSPQKARSVLPNSTKTEIVITTNFREWHHIFTLRCSKAAHPQMREVMIPLLERCKKAIPIIFDNITY